MNNRMYLIIFLAFNVTSLLAMRFENISRIQEQKAHQLRTAAEAGDSWSVQQLLKQRGFDVNAKDEYGHTALMLAARNSQRDNSNIIKMLIDAGAFVNDRDNNGLTALKYAVYGSNPNTVNIFLQKGAKDLPDNYGETAEQMASKFGQKEIVNLIKSGGMGGEKEKELRLAAQAGDVVRLQELLIAGANVNIKDEFGRTPLMLAAKNRSDNPKVIEMLINAGANVNKQHQGGWTALMFAAYTGNKNTVNTLLLNGAKDLPNVNGETAEQIASKYGMDEIVKLIKSGGSLVKSKM